MASQRPAQADGADAPPASATRRARRATGSETAATGASPGAAANPALSGAVIAPSIDDEDGSWVEADAVEVHQGAIGRVDATEVAVTQGAIGAARGDRISIQLGAVGAAMGRDVSVSQGAAGAVLAQQATVDQSIVRTLIAQEVEFRRPGTVLVLIAQRVTGDVRVLLDWRGAIAFGAAFGLVAGLFGRGRRRR
jgi:hypothetical protein